MDRKPQTQKYPPQKNYNKNYLSEPKVNNDHIDTIYTDISTGEYDDIIKLIDSNKILNFRNKEGETLIHAILKNPSSTLTEQYVLNIIEKLVHKNVSINSMNEYNQVPLHLAAKHGYYDIIDYLISLKSDFNKIDNYGNAPVHYLIDNFVSECKEGEYFKISNKKSKKTSTLIKYEQTAENYLILYLIEELENYVSVIDAKNTPKFLLEKIRKSVEYYKFYKISDINKVITSKKIEIDNLYTKHNPETFESDVQKILHGSVTEFYNLYKEFTFENKIDSNGESELINDNILTNIKISIEDKKNSNAKEFEKQIKNLKNKIDEIQKLLLLLKSNIYILIKILYFSVYIRSTISAISLLPVINITEIRDIASKIIKMFFCLKTDDTNFFNFDSMISNEKIIDKKKQKIFTNFVRFHDLTAGKTLEQLPLTYELSSTGIPVIKEYETNPIRGSEINIEFIINNYSESGTKILTNSKCLLSILLNILNYCWYLLSIVYDDINLNKSIDKYPYFYLNYINEIIVNVINNIIIFKTLYAKFNINSMLDSFLELSKKIIDIGNDTHMFLIAQVQHISDTTKYDTSDPEVKKELEEMDDIEIKTLYSALNIILTNETIYNSIEKIYGLFIELYRSNNNIVQITNKNYSLQYLLSFVELINNRPMNATTTIDNFCVNNFFVNESKFPEKLTDYIAKYFADYKFIPSALNSVKKDLLKKYYDYDFNHMFTTSITAGTPLKFDYKQIVIISDKLKTSPTTYIVTFDNIKFNTGYDVISYTKPTTASVDNNSIFFKNEPTSLLITSNDKMKWLIANNVFTVLDEPIPFVSLDNGKNIIQLIAFKIINLLDKTNFDEIIRKTEEKLIKEKIPTKTLQIFNETFLYLLKAENINLLKKIMVEKLIIFINSYLKIQINREVNNLLSNISDKFAMSALNKIDSQIIENVKSHYDIQLKKYTLRSMIPKILKNNSAGTFDAIIDAMTSINTDAFITSGQKKLLLDKCVINDKIDPLKNKLSGKINLRILDRNGNTILNRLIDQFNEYAVSKVLEIDSEIYTYQNNRGQNSISYLYDVLNSIDKNYTHEIMDKRIRTYERNLQTWIKSNDSFDEIELDDKQQMIYNVILNSLYLFNECMWMILLKSPNGWKYEDKIKLKKIIAKIKKFNIKEKLLIKSLTDTDKDLLKSNLTNGSLNSKITFMINELKEEITQLTNTNMQLETEKKNFELVDKGDIDTTLNPLILKNTSLIAEKNKEILNLEGALSKFPTSFNKKIDDAFKAINDAKLINEVSMNWTAYNKLVMDELWNLYLPIMELANNKNNNSDEKYMSFYNYGLLNVDYTILDDSEIQLLVDYNIKIINNIYGDYYDLEKYEDIEYNYINDIILNIIYLNVVKVIGIEMYSALIEYLSNKYASNNQIINVMKNYKHPEVFKLFDTIEKLLINSVWDKLKVKNPEKNKSYQDESFYKDELKRKITIIFDLLDNEDDNLFINKIMNFYTGLCANISYNIHDEIVNFLNDLKKHSLLFGILNLIRNKIK